MNQPTVTLTLPLEEVVKLSGAAEWNLGGTYDDLTIYVVRDNLNAVDGPYVSAIILVPRGEDVLLVRP